MSKRQADNTLPQVQVSDDNEMMTNTPSKKRWVHEGSLSSSSTSTVHPMGESNQSPLQPSQSLDGRQLSRDQEYRDSSNSITSLGSMPSFPAILYSILRRPDLQDILGWMPDGKSWRIVRPREFEMKVLPNYFNNSKYSSFLRQAYAWGFRSGEPNPRLTDKYHSYYHELFLRDVPHMIKIMEQQQQRRYLDISDHNHSEHA
jgi:hypothetical protein